MGGYGDVKLLRDDGLRLDGHRVDEMREVKVEAGILPAATVLWVKHGLNVAVCAVYGPMEAHLARFRGRIEQLSMSATTWHPSLPVTEFAQDLIVVQEKSAK